MRKVLLVALVLVAGLWLLPVTGHAADTKSPEAATGGEHSDGGEAHGDEHEKHGKPAHHDGAPAAQAHSDGGHGAGGHGDGGHAEGGHEEGAHGTGLGAILPLWACIPFAGILLSIAIFPLLAPHFWHHHYPKISAFWAILFAVPFLGVYGNDAFEAILHIYVADYIPFIILLWALFTVAGGIVIRGSLQ
ncbi:MAG: hypothetical protein CL928_10400, partial [Deltaproteobacteria bacterium]|nr:hypothetical protein [Deltaproteobacteria bacterium]